MATQICPRCKENSFTWSVEDENSGITDWGCYECGYHATENESEECVCENCKEKTKIRLKDSETEYWWCCRCNKIDKK